MVKTMPGSIACMLPTITCGASWTSRPRPWPVLVSTRSPKPEAREALGDAAVEGVEGHRRRGDGAAELVGGAHGLVDVAVLGAGGADEEGAGDVGHVAAPGRAEVDEQRLARAPGGGRGSGCRAGRRRRRRRARSDRRRARRRRRRASRPRGAGGSRSRSCRRRRRRAWRRARALADRDRPAHGVDLAGAPCAGACARWRHARRRWRRPGRRGAAPRPRRRASAGPRPRSGPARCARASAREGVVEAVGVLPVDWSRPRARRLPSRPLEQRHHGVQRSLARARTRTVGRSIRWKLAPVR